MIPGMGQIKEMGWGLDFGIQAAKVPSVMWHGPFIMDLSLVQGLGDE